MVVVPNIPVNKEDLVYMLRVAEDILKDEYAHVNDNGYDDSKLVDLEELVDILEQYNNDNRD